MRERHKHLIGIAMVSAVSLMAFLGSSFFVPRF